CAEPALARPRRAEGVGPHLPEAGLEAVQRRHRAPPDPPGRSDTGDARGPVDQHRAAPALALRAAAVLGRAEAEAVAQHLEERGAVVLDLDGPPVHHEGHSCHAAGGYRAMTRTARHLVPDPTV